MPFTVTVCASALPALGTYLQAAAPTATGTEDVICLECARCDMKSPEIRSSFPLLVVLRASRAKISQIPQVPKHLLYVDLSHNKLASLRPLEELSCLLYLNVSHNRVISLEGLQGCRQLRELVVDHNLLSDLRWLTGCVSLEAVLLHSNNLPALTALRPVAAAVHLRHITLAGNPCTDGSALSAARRAVMSLFPAAVTLDGRRLSRSPIRRRPSHPSAPPDSFCKRVGHSVYRPLQLCPARPPVPIPAPPPPVLPESAALTPAQALSRGATPAYPEVIIQPAPEAFVRLLLAVARAVTPLVAPGMPTALRSAPVPGSTWPRPVAPAGSLVDLLRAHSDHAGAAAGALPRRAGAGMVHQSRFSVWQAPAVLQMHRSGATSVKGVRAEVSRGLSGEGESGACSVEEEQLSGEWLRAKLGQLRSPSMGGSDSGAGLPSDAPRCTRPLHRPGSARQHAQRRPRGHGAAQDALCGAFQKLRDSSAASVAAAAAQPQQAHLGRAVDMETCALGGATSTCDRREPSPAVADLPPVGEDLAMTLRMVDAAAAHVDRHALARGAAEATPMCPAAAWRPLDSDRTAGWRGGTAAGVSGQRSRLAALGSPRAMQTLWPSAAAMLE
eukprot:jgi/Ulvmu1/6519/UM003_0152.1